MNKQKKSKIDDITKKLEEGIEDMLNSENFARYLKVMTSFRNYSFNNVILIGLQYPEATLVAGYKEWNKKGRHVKQGSKAIKIMAPIKHSRTVPELDSNGNPVLDADGNAKTKQVSYMSFTTVPVFDISQTEGEDLPSIAVDELKGDVKDYQHIIDTLTSISPVPVIYEDIQGGAKGYFSSKGNKIVVKTGMSQTQTIKTLLHEMSHAALHGEDGIAKDADRQTKEIQAESTAFVVSNYLGIDTSDYSFGYIAGWSTGKDKKVIKDNLEIIKIQANSFIKQINEKGNNAAA